MLILNVEYGIPTQCESPYIKAIADDFDRIPLTEERS